MGLEASLDLEYLGAFRVVARGESTSSYAAGALGYNSTNNSLYMAGHSHDNAIAEFQVPDSFSKEESALNIIQANVLQSYTTILDKKEVGKDTDKITGILYYKDNLIVNSEIWYDGNGTNVDNLQVFTNAHDLRSSAHKGLFQLEGAALSAGYMGEIPESLQQKLGGKFFTGWASNYGITSRYSQGPSLHIFDPQDAIDADVNVDVGIETTAKMVFPFRDGHPMVVGGDAYKMDISPMWGPLSRGFYGFIIPNTEIFMVVGSNGGIHSGIGYKITQDSGRVCGGPCSYEADDRYNYFWLFNINDIAEADEPWLARPISYGKWSHPYDSDGSKRIIGGAYDAENERLFLTLTSAGKVGAYDNPPLIITYKVSSKQ
jgi:hypothetical protein